MKLLRLHLQINFIELSKIHIWKKGPNAQPVMAFQWFFHKFRTYLPDDYDAL